MTKPSKLFKNLDKAIKSKDLKNVKNLLIKFQSLCSTENLDFSSLDTRKEILRVILRNDIKFSIYNDQNIESLKLELTYLLGHKFHNEIRDLIVNQIVVKYCNEFRNSINDVITSFECIKNAIEIFYNIFDKAGITSIRYPKDWNIKGAIVFNICIYLKQKINDFIFLKGNSINVDFEKSVKNKKQTEKKNFISEIIEKVIEFEKSVTFNNFLTECCYEKTDSDGILSHTKAIGVYFTENDVIITDKNNLSQQSELNSKEHSLKNQNNNNKTICSHKKMLSSLFIPFISIYLSNMFDFEINYDFFDTEMNIYSFLIDFFQKTGTFLFKLKYFDNPKVYEEFIKTCDKKLFNIIKNIKIQKNIKETITVLSSLDFIGITFLELCENIMENDINNLNKEKK